MNTVTGMSGMPNVYSIRELIKENFLKHGKTAFIGRLDSGRDERERLFLICFSCVMEANSPWITYVRDGRFIVNAFVDIEIKISNMSPPTDGRLVLEESNEIPD